MKEKTYKIEYEFHFDDEQITRFNIEFDQQTMTLIRPDVIHKPDWTNLENEQCDCCTLSKDEHPYCPVALDIAELLEEFKDSLST